MTQPINDPELKRQVMSALWGIAYNVPAGGEFAHYARSYAQEAVNMETRGVDVFGYTFRTQVLYVRNNLRSPKYKGAREVLDQYLEATKDETEESTEDRSLFRPFNPFRGPAAIRK